MSTRAKATIEDLYKVDGKAELIDGEIVHMPPTGGFPNLSATRILISLSNYVERTGVGIAASDNAAFVVDLPHRKTFSPDVAYYIGSVTMKFFEGAPVFAVEVRSEGDYGSSAERAMAAKRAEYFAAGTLVVWDVDLLSDDLVRVYRSTDPLRPKIYRRGDVAEAEPAVPGWTIRVNDLLPKEMSN
jgi:Uma2 family endonuclease